MDGRIQPILKRRIGIKKAPRRVLFLTEQQSNQNVLNHGKLKPHHLKQFEPDKYN